LITEYITFRNGKKISELTPIYEYRIFGGQITDVNFQELSSLILEKEKEILNKECPLNLISDGNTSLGPNSLTSRFRTYNVLKWEHPQIDKLLKNIKFFYHESLKTFNVKHDGKLYIQCWANVMRKEEEIKIHTHCNNDSSFLSGHITVQCDNTQTIYFNPILYDVNKGYQESYSFDNFPGKINIFQSNIPHKTTKHMSDIERITIAFDLLMINENVVATERKDLLEFNF
jgi:hypothetical protein